MKKNIDWSYYGIFENKWNHYYNECDVTNQPKDNKKDIYKYVKSLIINYYREHRFFCDVEKWELIKYIERGSDELATKIYENEQKRV